MGLRKLSYQLSKRRCRLRVSDIDDGLNHAELRLLSEAKRGKAIMNCATGLNLALFFRLALAVACLSGSSIAAAQGSARGDAAYPNRPIKLIVAFPPGGGPT